MVEVIGTKIQVSSTTKYQFPKWQWIFSLLRRFFLSSVADTTFIGFDYMSNAVGVLKKQQMLILNKNLGSLLVCCRGICCSSFSGLCVVVIFVLFVSGLCILLHVACVSELFILGCPLVFTKTNCFGWRSLNYIHQVYHFSRDDVHIIYSVLWHSIRIMI